MSRAMFRVSDVRDAIETAVVRLVDDGHLPAVAGPDVADELYETVEKLIDRAATPSEENKP